MVRAARKCPVGVQVFGGIRNRNLMDVDKTRYIYDPAHLGGRYVFLSRPQRFGKTLLVSCGMGCLATGFFPPFCQTAADPARAHAGLTADLPLGGEK